VADLFAAFHTIVHDIIIIIIAEKDTNTALYFLCSTFFQRSPEAVIAGACRRYFTNVCLYFNLKFLKQNKRVHSFHIAREIVLYVLFYLLLLQKLEALRRVTADLYFWRTLYKATDYSTNFFVSSFYTVIHNYGNPWFLLYSL